MASLSNGHSIDIKFTKLFINGQFVDSVSGKTFETIDPRTGDVIASVAEATKEDVDAAVQAARHAFDSGPWPRMSGSERGRILMKWADLIDQHTEEIAALDTMDAGKLFQYCKMEVPSVANMLRYYAGAADKIHGEVLKTAGKFHAYTLLEPIGVVGHIIPWNFPSTLFYTKVSPSLAAGCTMVVKPAEQTPLSALFYAHLAKLAGIPDGVLNVVPGFGKIAGSAVCSHMDIDKVSFTGSTQTGREVMQAAAKSNLKQVSLELGGKSPIIIFDDADVDTASQLALIGILFNKGEVCVAGSRVFVQEGIYDEFEKYELVKSGREVEAAYFASESGLTEKFPPINLLKSYLRNIKTNATTSSKSGNNSQAAMDESSTLELNSIKAAVKCIEDLKVESAEFNLESLRKRVAHLEISKAERKRSLTAGKKSRKRALGSSSSSARGAGSSSFRSAKAPKYDSYPSLNRKNPAPPPQPSPVSRFSGSFNYPSQTVYDGPAANPYATAYGAPHSQSPIGLTPQHYSLPSAFFLWRSDQLRHL